MKNIEEVIRQKEAQIQQLQRDLEVLRAAAALLNEEDSRDSDGMRPAVPRASSLVSDALGAREPILASGEREPRRQFL